MNINTTHTTIDKTINLTKIPLDATIQYELDQKTEWLNGIYDEVEEHTDREDPEYSKGSLTVKFEIKRRSEKPFGDHLLMHGSLKADFHYPCVRCLKLTKQSLSEDFGASFLHDHMETLPEFEEADDIFAEGRDFDLYFHTKGKIDVAEAIHEQLFIHVDAFPLHDPDCKGLCSQCGTDLNIESCKHSK
jgi:uncharacterized protein